MAGLRAALPDLEHVLLVGDDGGGAAGPDTRDLQRLLAEASPDFEIGPTDPEDLALLHFTSGTTGTPKGAVHVHQAVVAHHVTGQLALDLHPDDVFWCTADPGWVTGTSYGIVAPLTNGVTSLPVLFLCENNLYAMGTALARHQAQTDLCRKAESYGMCAETVDGMDVLLVEAAVGRLAEAVRLGHGPHFLELRTYRFRAHSMADPELYRAKEEVEGWKARDPIATFTARLRDAQLLGASDLVELKAAVAAEIAAAVAEAEAGPWEPVEDLTRDVYTEAPR